VSQTTLEIPPETLAFYRRAVDALNAEKAPFLVGGSYAFERYTGISRHSKDFDTFVRKQDRDRVLDVLERAGCRTELTFPHWLAKAYDGEDWVDVIHGGGSGIATVDDEWFQHSVEGEVLGAPVRLIPAEEMIWSKAYVMERERYDGADIAHLILRSGERMDWKRLLRRFGPDWRVLMSYLVIFGFVYPSERDRVPRWVTDELADRLRGEATDPPPRERVCQGTVISRLQYLHDLREWGFRDVREDARVHMDDGDIAQWTDAGLTSQAEVKK
jgi:hypothetical protein